MRLTDFENDDALDLLANILEPAAEIMSDQAIVEKVRGGKPMIYAVSDILRRHKKSAKEIVAAIHGVSPAELKFNVITLTKDLLDILNDPELQQVFQSQGQTDAVKSSGSATENIEVDGQ